MGAPQQGKKSRSTGRSWTLEKELLRTYVRMMKMNLAGLPFPWRIATALSASCLLLQRSTDPTCLNPADSRLCSFACTVAWTFTTAPLSPTVTRQATLSFTVPSPTEWTRPLAASTPCHHKPPPAAWHSVWARTILTAGGIHSDWDLWRLEVEIAFVLDLCTHRAHKTIGFSLWWNKLPHAFFVMKLVR